MPTLTKPVYRNPARASRRRAVAWLQHHIAADRRLAGIFCQAADVSWSPLIDFVEWAIDNGHLHNDTQTTPANHQSANPSIVNRKGVR